MEYGLGDETFETDFEFGAKKHQDLGSDTQDIWAEVSLPPKFLHRQRLEKMKIITPRFTSRGD
jgi:hypothetical protein